MKTKITFIKFTLTAVLFLLALTSGRSQTCAGNQARISIENVTATANTLEFDIYVENIGTTQLKMSCCVGSVKYDGGLLPEGATGTFTVVTQPSAADFPTFSTVSPTYYGAQRMLRWVHTPASLTSGNTVDFPANTSMKFARFRFTSSLPWGLDATASFEFPASAAGGYQVPTLVVYCEGNPVSTAITQFAGGLLYRGLPPTPISNLLSTTAMNAAAPVVAFPNPFSNGFRLNMEAGSEDAIGIKVYDSMGKMVESKQVKAADISKQEFGNNYQSGIYNVVLLKGETQQTIRVVRK